MAQQRDSFCLYIGRWCPFHEGHKYIIDSMLAGGHRVAIAVRDSEDEIPASVRAEAIRTVYRDEIAADRVRVLRIPDIDTVCVGRGVGYAIMEAPEEIQRISGTAIRAGRQDRAVPAAQAVIDAWKAAVAR